MTPMGTSEIPTVSFTRETTVPNRHFGNPAPESYLLIVDDAPTVLEVARNMAIALGWRPLLANTPAHALKLFRQHADAIDHVLVDLNPPGDDALALVREMRELRPDVHIDMMTGDSSSADELVHHDAIVDGILLKPFDLADLRQALEPDEPQARAA